MRVTLRVSCPRYVSDYQRGKFRHRTDNELALTRAIDHLPKIIDLTRQEILRVDRENVHWDTREHCVSSDKLLSDMGNKSV
jgi:hypothetical protein